MKVAIASGKGGTGKTTVATNLAYAAAAQGCAVAYLDCDVEEPNGHLFLKPQIERSEQIRRMFPIISNDACIFCGRCSEVCRYGAIACLKNQVLVFDEICHSCGGCELACPTKAIREAPKSIGELQIGRAGGVQFVEGRLNVGEAASPPAIHAVKTHAIEATLTIIDCPPGTSCPAIEGVRGCDLVLLVAEPTPFGLNDLALAVEMTRALSVPFAVALNRCDMGDDEVRRYCRTENIRIIAEFPDERAVAEAYSRGDMANDATFAFANGIRGLLEELLLSSTQSINRFAGDSPCKSDREGRDCEIE